MLYFPNRAMTSACNSIYSLKSNGAFCAWKEIKYNKTPNLKNGRNFNLCQISGATNIPMKEEFLVIFQSAVLGIPPGCQDLEPNAPPGGKRETLQQRSVDRQAALLWWMTNLVLHWSGPFRTTTGNNWGPPTSTTSSGSIQIPKVDVQHGGDIIHGFTEEVAIIIHVIHGPCQFLNLQTVIMEN